MRMGTETRKLLRDTVLFVLHAEHNAALVEEYSKAGWSQQRLAWDLLWEAQRCDLINVQDLYDLGFRDDQIERAIVKVTPDPQGYSVRGQVSPQVQAVSKMEPGDRHTIDGRTQCRVYSKERSVVTVTLLDESGNPVGTLRRIRPQRLTAPEPVGCEGSLPDILGD